MISNSYNSYIVEELLESLKTHGIQDLRGIMTQLLNELMKIEREQVLNAEPYERTDARQGYANGYKNKTLKTRLGEMPLKVPQTRGVEFYPSCLKKGERTEQALVIAVAEMYFQGVSVRKVQKITEELCEMKVTQSQVSRMAKTMDEELSKFRTRNLESMKYLYIDADYQKVRHEGCVRSMAVLKAIGVNAEGGREVLGISCSLSEAEIHWREFLESLFKRGLKGVELVISDSHSGLRASLNAVIPSVPWQRCIFHLAQNAQHYAPNQAMKEEIAQSVREIYQARSLVEARARIKETVETYKEKASKFVKWLEENFEEGLTFFLFPKKHWRKIRTVNMVERLNREIKRRTNTVVLFPNEASCERLVTSVAMDIHEGWVSEKKYMKFD